MCSKLFISSLLLSLLPGCVESGYLVTSLSGGDPAASGQSATQATALRYTTHRPATTVKEIVGLRIDGPFSLGDHAKILRAVNEWNVALNGFVRFVIVDDAVAAFSDPRQAQPWTVVAAKGVGPRVAPGPTTALAHTLEIPGAGGVMFVYLDRIGMRDLGGVVMHELGHVLGLGHSDGGLMAARYHPTNQQCIDKATIAAVAAKRRLTVEHLNWCETNVAGAAR